MSDLISFVPTPTATTGNAATSAASLSSNFDTFLTILTAQIQNQDPLEPMDSTQFTDQLVQFSGVEQQIRVNSQLETLIKSTNSSAGASLAGYLGQEAVVDTAGAQFTGEPVRWQYELPKDATSTTVTVTDATGKVLYSKTGELKAGTHDFTWNGELLKGGTASVDKPYWISVVAEDADKKAITPVHSLITKITGVDLTYGEPALTTPAGVFAFSDIKRMNTATTPATTTTVN
ncbi:MAG TPA: flagellar hook capping FlgD N-terminal domain-containing protein [Hyphomonadaceae bacterium]|nr:flagellar hook capping FlgD N-terminal domain-containing protein [Hyphomonadaceae bacterium]HPN04583.1 flagellar hook capping FlgD N-terminal domain-containing protein [Hyphomonadaceae bacterium]